MNFFAGLLVIFPLVSASHSPSSLSLRKESVCTDTHIFLARGWNENPYPGRQEILVNKTLAALSSTSISSDYEDILYYSTFEAVYCDSIFEGVANGISQIIAYNKRCPDTNLVISGYSQGAYIVGDIFGGGGGTFGDCVQKSNEGLDVESDAGKMVTAILVWGSKRHTASQPYNTFSGAEKNGTYPRPASELDALKKWTPVLRDYCVVTDPNCAGGTVYEDHWNYFELYTDQAVEWIKNQVDNNTTAVLSAADSSTTITSSTMSSSPTLSSPALSSPTLSSLTLSSLILSSPTLSSATSSEMPSAASQSAYSGTSTPSSGSAATTHFERNLLALAIAGSLAVCI